MKFDDAGTALKGLGKTLKEQQEYVKAKREQEKLRNQENNKNAQDQKETAQKPFTKETKSYIGYLNAPFPGLITTAYTDTSDMVTLFNNFLSPLFPDYYGCKIEIDRNRMLTVKICFVDSGIPERSGQYKVLEEIVDRNKINNNVDARIDYYNTNFANSNGLRNETYKLTDKAKEVLKEIIPSYFFNGNGKVNWKACSEEISINNFGKAVIGYQVIVDFNKLLKRLYGEICEDGSKWNYAVIIGNPINPVRAYDGSLISEKWQIFILRVKDNDVYDIVTQYNGYQQFGGNKMGFVPARRL